MALMLPAKRKTLPSLSKKKYTSGPLALRMARKALWAPATVILAGARSPQTDPHVLDLIFDKAHEFRQDVLSNPNVRIETVMRHIFRYTVNLHTFIFWAQAQSIGVGTECFEVEEHFSEVWSVRENPAWDLFTLDSPLLPVEVERIASYYTLWFRLRRLTLQEQRLVAARVLSRLVESIGFSFDIKKQLQAFLRRFEQVTSNPTKTLTRGLKSIHKSLSQAWIGGVVIDHMYTALEGLAQVKTKSMIKHVLHEICLVQLNSGTMSEADVVARLLEEIDNIWNTLSSSRRQQWVRMPLLSPLTY